MLYECIEDFSLDFKKVRDSRNDKNREGLQEKDP